MTQTGHTHSLLGHAPSIQIQCPTWPWFKSHGSNSPLALSIKEHQRGSPHCPPLGITVLPLYATRNLCSVPIPCPPQKELTVHHKYHHSLLGTMPAAWHDITYINTIIQSTCEVDAVLTDTP